MCYHMAVTAAALSPVAIAGRFRIKADPATPANRQLHIHICTACVLLILTHQNPRALLSRKVG
jgi:hypothetical protein